LGEKHTKIGLALMGRQFGERSFYTLHRTVTTLKVAIVLEHLSSCSGSSCYSPLDAWPGQACIFGTARVGGGS
jgi:hypothetical protein